MKQLEVKSIPFMDKKFRNCNIDQKLTILQNMAYYKNLKNKEIESLLFTKKTILTFSSEDLEKVFQTFPNSNISIDIDSFTYFNDVNDCIYTNTELKKIYQLNNIARKNNKKLYFIDSHINNSLREVICANRKLKLWAKTINEAKLDGKPLSPLEKFYYAFSLVTKYNYKDSENKSLARNLINILNTDGEFIVCFGYEQLLKELCKKIGIECRTNMVYAGDIEKEANELVKEYGNHVDCCVIIKDDKYKINGIYYSFPTNSAQKKTLPEALIIKKDINKIYSNYYILKEHMEYLFEDNLFYDFDYYKNNTKRIKKSKCLTAILNVLKAQNYSKEEINIKMTQYINEFNFLDKRLNKINNKKITKFNKKFIKEKSLEISF